MTPIARYDATVQFFFERAGWCYDASKETPEQGRFRCARQLADAEDWGKTRFTARWEIDIDADRSWMDSECGYDLGDGTRGDDGRPLWECTLFCALTGEVMASLSGIDLGWEEGGLDPYRRVIEADLALELMEQEEVMSRTSEPM